jgi:hypothetical protein
MAEELRPESAFGLKGAYDTIWHIAAAQRWADAELVGHRVYCGRNYPEPGGRTDLVGLTGVCSDCAAQVARPH